MFEEYVGALSSGGVNATHAIEWGQFQANVKRVASLVAEKWRNFWIIKIRWIFQTTIFFASYLVHTATILIKI